MSTMNNYKKYIEQHLNDYFKGADGYDKLIYDSMKYSLNLGGKRLRPTLMMMTYKLYKNDFEKILPLAVALEMIHTYSLIHDDLPCMDNDDLRRGKPTNHKVYGDGIATLAGDGLLNEAMNIMFDFSLNNGKKALEASALISHASSCEGMIGGQVVDIISEDKEITIDELIYMHSKKTGALIKVAILSGAVMGEASCDDIKLLESYGEKLGLAFQIIDDILDVVGDENVLGKSQSDGNNNKSNFIKFYGLNKCKKLSQNLTYECIDILNKLNRNTKELETLTLELLNRNF
ncbi:polyprenyl synthetase family protein [Clostridium cadaveris]|uniref:Farnesyl diphosphate synthase n=2 Tax=Clostridium TaxID=1485 RepID=A0A1I2J5X1_9CLOT|nr:geranylgeranyl diphosphate synthase, type II [Clostridium cadaveris]